MNSTSRLCLALGLLLLGSAAAHAQPREMEAGKHYVAIQPAIATDAATDVIEILDVFWYGCPVCSEFEPMMTYYGGQIRGDLTMRRMPAVWNPLMAVHARLYYTMAALDIAAQAHPAAFRYLQEEGQSLKDVNEVGAFLATLGVAADAFETAWDSPEVLAAVARAQRDTAAAGIEKLPALVTNGRYRVTRNAHVPELTEVIIITNQLIKTLRDERRVD